MSRENVKIVRPWIDAVNRGRIETVLRFPGPRSRQSAR
jgi:hypothetical protein